MGPPGGATSPSRVGRIPQKTPSTTDLHLTLAVAGTEKRRAGALVGEVVIAAVAALVASAERRPTSAADKPVAKISDSTGVREVRTALSC